MAWQINGRGSYVIDRRFKGVGRIRRASGIKNIKMLKKLESMLDNLWETGRIDVLRDIQNGVIHVMEAYEYWRTQEVEQIPSVATLRPLVPTISDWIERHDILDTTRKGYRDHFKAFLNVISGESKLLDLPKSLAEYKDHCIKKETPRAFNYTRSILQAYLNHTFGRHHTLWEQVSHIRPLKVTNQRQAPQLSVVEFNELTRKLPKEHADIARAMVTTGMHWKEIVGEWEVLKDRVLIHGTKAKGRDRFVPLIMPIKKPTRKSKAFRTALKKVRPDLSPYSFRRTYAHWLEMADIPRSRRRLYLGHSGPRDTTDIYERHEVSRFLKEDAKAFRDWIFAMWKDKDLPDNWKPPTRIGLL